MVCATRVLLLLACTLPGQGAHAADWPQFLGPDASGIAPDTGISKRWNEKPPQVLWRVAMRDGGFAGPSVAAGKVLIIDHSGADDVVRAIDIATGSDVWTFSYPEPGSDNFGFARSTPVVVDGKVYTLSRSGRLHCLDAGSGRKLWSRDIKADFGGEAPGYLYSMSPRVDGDKVIVCPGGRTGVAALNKDSGETIWTGGLGGPPGYATPAVGRLQGRKQYVIFSGDALYGVDADAGGPALWQVPWGMEYKVNAAVPIVADDCVFITCDYNVGCALIYVAPDGARVFWQSALLQAHFSSPVYYKGYFFGIGNAGSGGDLMCLSPQNGELAWRQPGFEKGGLVAVDDVIIAMTGDKGDVVMVNATADGYQELGRIQPLGGQSWTAPIVADGKLIIRNKTDLACLDLM